VCTADPPVLAALHLVSELVDDEVQRDLGFRADRVRGDRAVREMEDDGTTRVIGDARVALVGEVDLRPPRVVRDSLEPPDLPSLATPG
jgi:hypothetical protein